MADYIIFGSVDSRTYGVYVYRTNSIYESAEREYQSISIPGRSGDLLIDGNRYNNIGVEYQCIVPSQFGSRLALFRNALIAVNGYAKLQDSIHTDEFRTAYFAGFEVDSMDRDGTIGTFTIKFNCKPQRFLNSGLDTSVFTESGTLTNPTNTTALPKIYVRASGAVNGSFELNGTSVTITSPPFLTVILDSDLQSMYNGTSNLNAYVSQDFPVLKPGSNSIVFGSDIGNITQIDVIPRWWRL